MISVDQVTSDSIRVSLLIPAVSVSPYTAVSGSNTVLTPLPSEAQQGDLVKIMSDTLVFKTCYKNSYVCIPAHIFYSRFFYILFKLRNGCFRQNNEAADPLSTLFQGRVTGALLRLDVVPQMASVCSDGQVAGNLGVLKSKVFVWNVVFDYDQLIIHILDIPSP